MMSNIQAARALGWTSLAIGAAEIAATDWLQEQMGVEGHDTLLRAFGVREIASGVTILSQQGLNQTMAAGLWSRVVGDVLDLATLGAAAATTRRPQGLGGFIAFVMGAAVLDVIVASRVQADLHKAQAVSEAARRRVTQTSAKPPSPPMPKAGQPQPAM